MLLLFYKLATSQGSLNHSSVTQTVHYRFWIQEVKTKQLTIPLPLVASDETSAITAIERLTLPLLIPPTILANTNSAKLLDNAHRTYEDAIPTCFSKNKKIETHKKKITFTSI
jgi:hypothetical protein